MGGTDRVEVLCAARLEGPGLSRWSTCRLIAAAISRAGKLEVAATLEDRSYSGGGQPWKFTSKPKTEQEAVALVKAISGRPDEIFERGRVTGDAAKRESLKALFPGLTLKSLIDTTGGASELSGTAITVGTGRYLASSVEQGTELTADLAAGIERYFSQAPFTYGYWAPYKRLIKLLEDKPQALEILAVALARIDGQLQRVANVQANDELRSYVSPSPDEVAGPDTVAYLMRRARRLIRRLGRTDQPAYVRCAKALLKAADAQGAKTTIERRWILADILYGRGVSDKTHGHGPLHLPAGRFRYDRRWDLFPKAWNEHLDAVRHVWVEASCNTDIQVWAFNVLRFRRQELPPLSIGGLRLALLSPSERLKAEACHQVAGKPQRFLDLDQASARAFLEFSSAMQFSAVFPTLESSAFVKTVQDAVLAYIDEHGLPEIRRGALPSTTEKRSAVLLRYSLRHLRSRFNAADTYHLARYVGQTTQFKPLAQWLDTFNALPLKTLVELRLHLPDLPKAVVRSIDGACRDAVAKGAADENLAAALTLSPAPELRALGWALLANASDATLFTVWTNLIAQAGSPKGLETLLESLRFKDRLERIERHASGNQLLSSLVTAIAVAEPKTAEGLLLRLAAKGDSQRTLDTLGSAIAATAEETWARRPVVLQKLIALDPAITRLVWASVEGEQPSAVAQIHVATRSLANAMVDAIDADAIKTIGANQARYLTQALRSAPSRLYQERGFAVSCATCPHPELQQLAIARLEGRRLVDSVFVPLAESGMPAAIASAERYIGSIKDRSALTKAVITVCDSGLMATRAIGLGLIERHPERLDLNVLMAALAEHTSPDVTAAVARFAASGIAIRRGALDEFDTRVLKTRRVGRKAKDLVKSRLETLVPKAAVAIGAQQNVDDRRIQALVDMARGSSLRDRDWALQQLARLALDGHPIPQMQVSTTS